MDVITLYSFGYWGWGSAVPQWVSAFDAVEAARGYGLPLFVDIRISRSVRAKGFDGAAFENFVGQPSYRWIDALGNLAVKEGGDMRIKDPSVAHRLLDLAIERATTRRRIVFICACAVPCRCHRSEVARLVLKAATNRRLAVEVEEWPGGEPRIDLAIKLPRKEFDKVRHGARLAARDEAACRRPRTQGLRCFPPTHAHPRFRSARGKARRARLPRTSRRVVALGAGPGAAAVLHAIERRGLASNALA